MDGSWLVQRWHALRARDGLTAASKRDRHRVEKHCRCRGQRRRVHRVVDAKTSSARVAANIAARLLVAGRAGDALRFLNCAAQDKGHWVPREREDARISVLKELDRR